MSRKGTAGHGASKVVWTTPGLDSSGSMPLGNGDVGANVWVDGQGDLLFYLGKTDSWSENSRLLKLSRIRISPEPRLSTLLAFRQELDTLKGRLALQEAGPERAASMEMRIDANIPIVSIALTGTHPFSIRATLEIWRTERRRLGDKEDFSAYGVRGGPHEVIVTPDTVLVRHGRVYWYHRNESTVYPMTLGLQGMSDWAGSSPDPLLGRTSGGAIWGPGLVPVRDGVLESPRPRRRHRVMVHPFTGICRDAGEWLARVDRNIQTFKGKREKALHRAHGAWWREFWRRSWIRISTGEGRESSCVSLGYSLQRYLNACGGRGEFPIKFNGSIFTVDAEDGGQRFDADYRRWGGPYWFQNTRLPYWSMLMAGDFDLMRPLFSMYLKALPLAKHRTRIYFGHDGAFFPETMFFWGSYANENYGWDRGGKDPSHVDNRFIRWHYNSGLELIALMLDYFSWTSDRGFLKRTLLPLSEEIITFYDRHYERDGRGRICLDPSQALETYQRTVNPTPDLAGLAWDLDGLLALGEETGDGRLEDWERLRSEVPPIPLSQDEPRRVLPAEEVIEGPNNCENPELYPVFPYRIFGVNKPDLDVGRATFAGRPFKGNRGWQQDDIHAAMLGLTREAREMVADRFSARGLNTRFPAFWGPNFDWLPDQDHGCAGMIALQRMVMQCEGRSIVVLPAWPADWDLEFRLHAPSRTIVTGRYRAGRLEKLATLPRTRERDIVIQQPPG